MSLQNAPNVVCQLQSGVQDVKVNGIVRGKKSKIINFISVFNVLKVLDRFKLNKTRG
jgi:hypothetical protein